MDSGNPYNKSEWDNWRNYFKPMYNNEEYKTVDSYLNGIETLQELTSILQQHSHGTITLDNLIQRGESMASLSQRTHIHHIDGDSTNNNVNNLIETREENSMNTIKTVNITLVNENPNLKGEDKIVFQKMGYVTEYNDSDTKMNIIASGEVSKALTKHNSEVLTKTIDKAIQRTTGRDVMLEPIELLSDPILTWNIIQTA